MIVSFEKNIFYPNEVANSMVTVNNSKCSLKIVEIEFQVTQKVFIAGNAYINFKDEFDILENKDRSGLGPNHAEVTKMMQLNLSSIKFPVSATKKKSTGIMSSKTVNRSPEEIFQLS